MKNRTLASREHVADDPASFLAKLMSGITSFEMSDEKKFRPYFDKNYRGTGETFQLTFPPAPPTPMKTSTRSVLSDKFLLACMSCFTTEEVLLTFVNPWESAALKYLRWLKEEVFTAKQARPIIDAAVERADFNLSKFPVC
jgi:hypothetical protein